MDIDPCGSLSERAACAPDASSGSLPSDELCLRTQKAPSVLCSAPHGEANSERITEHLIKASNMRDRKQKNGTQRKYRDN